MTDSLITDWLARNQNYRCWFCKEIFGSQKIDPHHCLIHDTKDNRMKYPNLLNSMFNLKLVHRSCHDRRGNENKITEERAELLETMLAGIREVIFQYGIDRQELNGTIEFMTRKIERS